MAKFELEAPFNAVRGKLCKHSKIQFHKRNTYGTNYTSMICRPCTAEATIKQQNAKANFAQAATNTKALLEDVRQQLAIDMRFKAQNKYRTKRDMVFAEEYAKLKAAQEGATE